LGYTVYLVGYGVGIVRCSFSRAGRTKN